jgi:TolB-like protein
VRAEERVRLAVLPVVVHSLDGREYLQRGIGDMLISRLGREARIAVIPVEDPAAATTDPEAARKTAIANGADYVVFGSFTRFGEGASLDLACASAHDAEREPRKIYVHAETMAALIPLLDGVAERAAFTVLAGSAASGDAVSNGPRGESRQGELAVRSETPASSESSPPRASIPIPAPDPGRGAEKSGERAEPGLPTDRDAELVR